MDGLGAIRGGCPRCQLLYEIWRASLELNRLIRQFNPNHDDMERPRQEIAAVDPRQMSLIDS